MKVCKRNHERDDSLTRCPECERMRNRERAKVRRSDPEVRERDATYLREWRRRNPDYDREYKARNKDRIAEQQRARSLRERYGLSVDQYNGMLAEQGGVCCICEEPPTEENTRQGFLPVDHSHATGAVRGLLCELCNKALGLFKDDPIRLQGAINYLQRHHVPLG